MGAGKKSQTIGYEYGAALHMGLGLAADEVYRIDIGGKVAWVGSIKQNGTILINQPNLFGGKKGEGGVVGTLDVLFGGADQPQHGLLAAYLGRNIPAFRNAVTTVFNGVLCAMNWYPKSWEYCYRRIKSGWPNNSPWYPEKIEISLANGQIKAMNPAHILYESYVSTSWGAKVAPARMDEEAYRKAADTLHAEGFGLCFEWKDTDNLKNFRDFVTDHIGAVIGTDPRTGKNTIRLIRDDYNIEDLRVIDEDTGLLEFKFEASNLTEVPSQVIIMYTDAITFEERPAFANNPAIAQGQHGKAVETTEYPALPTGELATRVAYRELKAKTSGIKRCTLKLDRRAYDIVKGEPFRIKTKYRINNVDIVVRADRRQENFLTDGTIKLNAVQDVFSLPKLSFNPIPPAPVPEPPKPPVAVTQSLLQEITYRDLVMVIDAANLQLVDELSSYFYGLAIAPANQCYSYDLVARVKGANQFNEPEDTDNWCPTAIVSNDIEFNDRIINIRDTQLLQDLEIGSAALIDNEIVRVDSIDLDNNQLTIGRGCVDTVPVQHKTGAIIWFFDGAEASDGIEHSVGTIIEAKFLSNTFTERLPIDQAPTQTITLQGRQARPYPPANLKVNNLAYPEIVDDFLTISWSTRNRLLQADKLIDTTFGDVMPEDGTTYNLDFIAEGNTVHSVTGITNNLYTWHDEALLGDSLVMQFDKGTINDESSYSAAITSYGSPSIIDGTEWVGGKALSVSSATGDYLDIANHEGFDIGTGNFNFECCVSLNSVSSRETLLSLVSANLNGQYQFAINGGYPVLYVFSNGWITAQSTRRITANKQHHIAFSRLNGVLKIFVDGVVGYERNFNYSMSYPSLSVVNMFREARSSSSLYTFNGKIDQVRLAKRAIYIDPFTPPTEPFVITAGGQLYKELTVTLEAERDGLKSFQKHQLVIKRSN